MAAGKKVAPPSQMWVKRYGASFAPLVDPASKKEICPCPDWKIEARMFLCEKDKAPPGWLGKAEHFRRMISIIFASPLAKNPFQWNPNSVEIINKYFENDYLAVASHGSASKTETMAIILIGEFIADPDNTGCFATSTTLNESRGRIWGRIEYYWQDLCDYFGGEQNTPGELVSSSGLIRYRLGGRKDDTRGIKLVPGRESEVREGIGRMKGFKARRLRLCADELSDLSHKLLEAAESNLFINPDFKMVGGFNPSSYFDPAGVFSEPENGWGSVNILHSSGWKTKRGWCIRFDGEKSPNVVAGCEIWRGLITKEKLDEARKNLGDNSPAFMSQYRGIWSEVGLADSIYTEAEIIKYQGMSKVKVWTGEKTKAGGFDPSFVHDGDRAVLVLGDSGKAICFEKDLPCADCEEVIYLDDNLDTTKDKKEQVIANLKSACIKHGLDPKNLAMDATGGGDVFATLMSRDPFFSNKFMKVQFGGEASDLISEGKKGSDKFANMASELWYAAKSLLRMGQIRGLKSSIVREMTLRLYEESGSKKKIRIEPKKDMKARLNGRSPDCFVAGTMISTPNGERKIEQIESGDEVLTPFGISRVVFTHCVETSETVMVSLSNGRCLEGKPAHKILTDELKWVRMDNLCLNRKIESVKNRGLWIIFNALFTRVENSDFKQLVDTTKIRAMGRRSEKDFFIESSGLSILALFRKVCASITKMMIGRITESRIWNSCLHQNTRHIMPKRTSLFQKLGRRFSKVLSWLELPLLSGTELQRVWNGTAKHPKNLGPKEARIMCASVSIVGMGFSPSRRHPNTAQHDAGKPLTTMSRKPVNLRALFVEAISFLVNIPKRKVAVQNVEHKSWQKPVSVYNLTLMEENAYYANGCLVDNCSDAYFLFIHACRARLGLRSADAVAKPTKKAVAEDPLAGMFAWGQKKKPKMNEPEYVQPGGGWADEGSDKFGMFG